MSADGSYRFSLLHDDALMVRVVDADLLALVTPWLPLHAGAVRPGAHTAATIDVSLAATDASDRATRDATGEAITAGGAEPPMIVFGGVSVTRDRDDLLRLLPASPARGVIALGASSARIVAPPPSGDAAIDRRVALDVYSMLTLSAAFLLGRLGAALVHAGGVVDPEGLAWLLVGDTHAGKTTTCVSLAAAGWRFLADDQVVLRAGERGVIEVQGWPRQAHLDEGWSDAVVTGRRGTLDLRSHWGERWLSRAPLGGVLLPTVRADEPTNVALAEAATSFTALVRQSPWLIADRRAASAVMALLRDAASRPSFALSLGRDSYARGDVLAARLDTARLAAADRRTRGE